MIDSRNLIRGLIVAAILIGFSVSATAAPYNFNGTVANACSVSSPINLAFTMKSNGNGLSLAPQTYANYTINCNVKSSLSMQASALHTSVTPGTGESQIANYTATLSPWGAGVSATTTAPASDTGNTYYPASPTVVSSGAPIAASGTISIGTPTLPTGPTKWEKSAVYTGNIKLTLTVNN